MTLYLDKDNLAHIEPAEGLTNWEDVDGAFAGKCAAYIEGYRIVPEGTVWIRSDGVVFNGLMITPALSYEILKRAQDEYEKRTETITCSYRLRKC